MGISSCATPREGSSHGEPQQASLGSTRVFRQNIMSNSRRSVRYPGSGSRFYIPEPIWEETLNAIRRYGIFDSEGLVYWGGIVGATSETLVTSVLILNHLPQGGRVKPTRKEMRNLLRELRRRDEKLVAQIHSHKYSAFHSLGDNQNATSYHQGFVSLVAPNFGRGVTMPWDCAIYEFEGEFRPLSSREIRERFKVQKLVVTLAPWQAYSKGTSLWKYLSRKLKSIAHKKP